MRNSKTTLLKSAAVALSLALPVTGGAFFLAAPAMAATTLPAPYVSRALDAVLMPVDSSVITTFGLAAGTKGVLVIATDPTGLAAAAGIEPGDVIGYIKGQEVLTPVRLDEVVYYWIQKGSYDFDLAAYRAGAPLALVTTVTLEAWESVVDITTVSSWSSYSYESFSYSEYYSEYSEEITTSYESSETTIEESTTSEEFASDMETTDEGAEATDEAAADDQAAGDEAAGDEAAGDEAAADDAAGDDAAADDAAGDDAGGDDAAGDDAGGDDGGDAGGEEEPVE